MPRSRPRWDRCSFRAWTSGKTLPDPEQADPEVYKEVFYTLGSRDGVAPLYFPGYQQWDSTIYKKNMDQLWANATSDVAGILQQVHEETQAFLDNIEA